MKQINYLLLFFLLPFCSLKAQTPDELKAWLPSVDGWTISGEIEVFNPDNLFDRINGAAPLFLENNFREMTSMEYKKGTDYITIQAYRHATPEDAFGMYSSERSSDLEFLPVGGEAQGDKTNLYFFAGNMYLKMWSNASGDVSKELQAIGQALAGKIDAGAGYPAVIRLFPEQGKVPYSAAYITSNYIGHEFLRAVYTMKYEKGGQAFQLFVLDGGSPDGVKSVLTQYMAFTKQQDELKEGGLLIKDRYNGDIPVLWKGRYLVGFYNENGDTIAGTDALLEELADKL
ncbi:hypothetical protein DXD68_18450 [Parabacteroides sp. TM07-1AC]|jgi:hypothetical protein|uniref:DUF6599 family protein n=1 Tax=Parabacteroides sp. TM07-1AC TaxID=2292363 RepID=UPI000EFE26A4|nr:DUF6599 family protein [Parabacteroides sp. TM07-1AC]RHU23655.1 hypothetical protein DXD68_18450 [Parabacteroides sp. TM07-1AC]